MKPNIRERTVLIIKRGNEYLVGRILGSTEYRWSLSPWDAWCTRNREDAETEARRTGGDIWLFNPIAGQLKERIKDEDRRKYAADAGRREAAGRAPAEPCPEVL